VLRGLGTGGLPVSDFRPRCGQDGTTAGDVYARFRTAHPPALDRLAESPQLTRMTRWRFDHSR